MFKRFRTLLYRISKDIQVKRYNKGMRVTYHGRFLMVPNEILKDSNLRELVGTIWVTLNE